ncbi:MAG: carbon-nitrogen hydrolase family protein [Bacteroidota bacterium]
MKLNVALIQAAPVFLDLNRSIDRVEQQLREVSDHSPDLVVFPEAFLPGYPRGLSFGSVVGSRSEQGRDLWLRYSQNALTVPGPDLDRLSKLAKHFSVHLVIGVVERSQTGTLFCTTLYFDAEGRLIGKHRKLKPTASERVIWGEGDGADLEVYDTAIGRIGGLICWENYMPLARAWLYEHGVQIYIAPTADQRDSWQSTLKHIACEGRCFVLGCNQYVRREDYPDDLPGESVDDLPEVLSRGGSVVVDPLGEIVAGPIWDESGSLFAVLDLDEVTRAKLDFDAAGHYARGDVFELRKKV